MNIKQLKLERILLESVKINIFNNMISKMTIANTHDEIEFLVDSNSFIIFNLDNKTVYINVDTTKLYFNESGKDIYFFIYINFYRKFKYLINKPTVTKSFYRKTTNYIKIKTKDNENLLKYI